jgi:hypothetical protein
MATRYWVLGSGTWDTTTTTNWSTTSGGVGGASAPTSADDVIFDANSNVGTTAFTVTLGTTANCLSFSTGGAGGALDGVMTFNSPASASLNVYGSFTLPTSNLTWAPTSALNLNFLSTTTGNTVTTNGVNLANTFITFNGVGGGWTLGSAITIAVAVYTVIAGTFDTGNYNMTGAYFATSSVLAKTVNWGSSTITSTNAGTSVSMVSTGLTFNAGTSTYVVSGGGAFTGAGLTFYNVSYTLATGYSTAITGANTYNNLSFVSRTTAGVTNISIGSNLTINGTLTIPAATTYACLRYYLSSATYGTPITITAAAVSLADVDFRDITGAGTATWSGTRIGNQGGNSGITFTTATTFYWNLAGSQNITNNTGWATTPTGAPSANNFPLPQDVAAFTDNNPASGISLGTFGYTFGTLDFSARTLPLTFSVGPYSITFCKDLILSSAITVTGTQFFNFSGRGGTQTITSAGVTIPQNINAQNIGGTVQHADAFVTTGGITVLNGTYASNYNLTCFSFASASTNTRAITFGGNVVSLTGTGIVWNFSVITGLTFNAGTSTISLTDNSATARTFFGSPSSGAGLTYWNLQSAGTTGGSALTIIGNNTFNNISSTKTVAHSILFTAGSTTTLRTWTVSGSAGNLVTISSPTAAFHTLVKLGTSNVSADYLNISYSHAS